MHLLASRACTVAVVCQTVSAEWICDQDAYMDGIPWQRRSRTLFRSGGWSARRCCRCQMGDFSRILCRARPAIDAYKMPLCWTGSCMITSTQSAPNRSVTGRTATLVDLPAHISCPHPTIRPLSPSNTTKYHKRPSLNARMHTYDRRTWGKQARSDRHGHHRPGRVLSPWRAQGTCS